jgi:hypothetical protein
MPAFPAFILLADSPVNASVTALFFETLSSSGLGHRLSRLGFSLILKDLQKEYRKLPQNRSHFRNCSGGFADFPNVD